MIDARRRLNAVTFPPLENPDWDHARTRRLALRVPGGEWCQSVLSYRESDGFYYHRTDYAYEGLLSLVAGENWKALDRIGFVVVLGEHAVELTPEPVTATPDWVLYRFSSAHGNLSLRYQLFEAPGGLAVLGATYYWEGDPSAELVLKPIIDLRHMFYYSIPEDHAIRRQEPRLVSIFNNRYLVLGSDADMAFHPDRQSWDLYYRMGSGEREQVSGQVHFKREWFRGTSIGRFGVHLRRPVTLYAAAGPAEDDLVAAVRAVEAAHAELARAQDARLENYMTRFSGVSPDLVARFYVMAEKFGLHLGESLVPETGGWWFRTVWLRALFVGLLHNRQTLVTLGKGTLIEDAIRLALRYADPETGRLPNRVPEAPADLARWEETGRLPAEYYHGPDAWLMLFVLLSEHLDEIRDPELPGRLYQTFRRAFMHFREATPETRGGFPVVSENGLLMTLPDQSWISGRRTLWVDGLRVDELPIRVDRDWQTEAIRQYQDAQYTRDLYRVPAYYLPEINAQWIRALEVGISLADREHDEELVQAVRTIHDRAIANYKRIFWNSGVGYLYNLITREGRPDPMVTSPGIEAAALLGGRVFSRNELAEVWKNVRAQLLVNRESQGRPAAFGVLVKDSAERIFYDDEQYHEAVCWPRETPYLIRILTELGEEATISEILATNLAHQMDEGVVFYANEIFSLPEGINPAPNLATGQDPVPVKNPMHWASQWCDPYLARA